MAKCAKPGCGLPVFVEPRTQIAHDFCGRTHAVECLGEVQEPHGPCHQCNLRGCVETVAFDFDTGRVHDFCCLDHAQLATQRGEWPHQHLRSSSSLSSSLSGGGGAQGKVVYCRYPRCTKPCFSDGARVYDFCGRTHAFEFKSLPTSSASASSGSIFQRSVSSGGGISSGTYALPPQAVQAAPQTAPVADPPKKCCICLTAKCDTVLVPCGHLCVCMNHANELLAVAGQKKCPLCRAEIASVVRVQGI